MIHKLQFYEHAFIPPNFFRPRSKNAEERKKKKKKAPPSFPAQSSTFVCVSIQGEMQQDPLLFYGATTEITSIYY